MQEKEIEYSKEVAEKLRIKFLEVNSNETDKLTASIKNEVLFQ